MDLDKLKNTWQKAEIKLTMNENQIQQILNNKGKSAFNKLIRYEKIGFIVSFLLIIASIGLIILSQIALKIKDDYFPLFFCVSTIFISIWQGYKYKFLNKIDTLKMDILQVSQNINTYKKYIAGEWIVAIIWTIAMFLIFFINKLPNISLLCFIMIILAISAYAILITFIIYKLTISRYLINIEESIKEVEELRNDNEE